MSQEDEVLQASRAFYNALTRMAEGDSSSMAGIWSHGEAVTAMHPIGGLNTGWPSVEASFAQVASAASGGHIGLEDQVIRVHGDVAYEMGTERGEATLGGERIPIDWRVTNVYQRENGTWKIVHHHTDVAPAMVAFATRQQP